MKWNRARQPANKSLSVPSRGGIILGILFAELSTVNRLKEARDYKKRVSKK